MKIYELTNSNESDSALTKIITHPEFSESFMVVCSEKGTIQQTILNRDIHCYLQSAIIEGRIGKDLAIAITKDYPSVFATKSLEFPSELVQTSFSMLEKKTPKEVVKLLRSKPELIQQGPIKVSYIPVRKPPRIEPCVSSIDANNQKVDVPVNDVFNDEIQIALMLSIEQQQEKELDEATTLSVKDLSIKDLTPLEYAHRVVVEETNTNFLDVDVMKKEEKTISESINQNRFFSRSHSKPNDALTSNVTPSKGSF